MKRSYLSCLKLYRLKALIESNKGIKYLSELESTVDLILEAASKGLNTVRIAHASGDIDDKWARKLEIEKKLSEIEPLLLKADVIIIESNSDDEYNSHEYHAVWLLSEWFHYLLGKNKSI